MENKLEERFMHHYGADTAGITNLVSTIKRTKTALDDIQGQFARINELTAKEKQALEDAIYVLQTLASKAGKAKANVKKYAADKKKLQERLRKESFEAIKQNFSFEKIDESVYFLAWDSKLHVFQSLDWRRYVKEEMVFDNSLHKWREPNILGELRSRNHDYVQNLISSVAHKAESESRSVIEIVAELKTDFNKHLPSIMEKEKEFIQKIKVAVVEQSLTALNKSGR